MTTELFTKDYVTYDQYGLAEVRCMATNIPIKSRMEEPSKLDPKRFVYVLGNHSNYREFPVLLSDGSVSFLMVCTDMENVPIGVSEAARITKQIYDAKKIELESQGKPKEVVNAVLDGLALKKKVLRRLTPQEINEKFGGTK